MIDQTTYGHKVTKDQLSITPTIGWQIDPFGHSAMHAYLLGAEYFPELIKVPRIASKLRVFRFKLQFSTQDIEYNSYYS